MEDQLETEIDGDRDRSIEMEMNRFGRLFSLFFF
ncbi:hypothetical protein CsSME_00029530 [Camellia sinensis var. sinensis]